MKEALVELLQSGSFRRFFAFILTPVIVLANTKFGLNLNVESIAVLAINSAAYIFQSMWKEVKKPSPTVPDDPNSAAKAVAGV